MLLDEDGNPVESGDVGEIAVKSRYFAVGYWRQSELTKAKFLPDPKGGDGANLYDWRSGLHDSRRLSDAQRTQGLSR